MLIDRSFLVEGVVLASEFFDIHGPQQMNPAEFSDPLTFSLAPRSLGFFGF